MTDETISLTAVEEFTNPGQPVEAVQDIMEVFLDTASVERVYGEPIQQGDTLIIPAAEVLTGLGFGLGGGIGIDDQGNTNSGGGGGGGGGGRSFARPVAAIIASPNGVRIEPVVDVTKIALAMFTAAGFMAGMCLRMMSRRRTMKLDECAE